MSKGAGCKFYILFKILFVRIKHRPYDALRCKEANIFIVERVSSRWSPPITKLTECILELEQPFTVRELIQCKVYVLYVIRARSCFYACLEQGNRDTSNNKPKNSAVVILVNEEYDTVKYQERLAC